MRDIKGYEGLYGITSCGKVWSYRSKKFLAPGKRRGGYLAVVLCKNGETKNFLIHRLVAEAYIPNPYNLPQINHIDKTTNHNWVSNLEWCDNQYNADYSKNKRCRCVETGEEWDAVKYVEKSGYKKESVARCCRGERETYRGLHWEYI